MTAYRTVSADLAHRCAARLRRQVHQPGRRTATDFQALWLADPNVVSFLASRAPSTPLGLQLLATRRPLEQLLQVFLDAGFGAPAALQAGLTAPWWKR